MRKTSKTEKFPFLMKTLKYYEVKDNSLYEVDNNVLSIKEAYLRATTGESTLYASWHGTYSTDIFLIDDLHELGVAFGFEKSDHVHEIEWKYVNPQEKGAYISIQIEFKCGCSFDTVDGKEKLKKDLLLCKGWEISSSGLGGCNSKYTVRVKRSSIKD